MIIKVKVKTNSSKQDIKKIKENEYEINLKNKAKDNKANIELLKLIKKEFGKEASIIKGKTSRNKIIVFKDGNKI